MTTRIYLVAACIAGQPQAPRLIEAGTAAAARNHATKDSFSVKPASAKEVAKLIGTGVKLEIAGEAPPEQQELPVEEPQVGLGSTPELPSAELPTAEPTNSEPASTADGSASHAVWPHDPPASTGRRNRSRAAA